MRAIGLILLILIPGSWLASELPLASSPVQEDPDDGWRLTRHGWERMHQWNADGQTQRPLVHPIVVGLLQLLLSLIALIAFSKPTGRRAITHGGIH